MSPLFITEEKIGKMLGHNITWLPANKKVLEEQYGLPPTNPAIGMRHVEAVEAWARERNMRNGARPERLSETNQENINAF